MKALRMLMVTAVVLAALAITTLATAQHADARGLHGGHGVGGGHRGVGQFYHGSSLHLRHFRHQQERHFFRRFTPCVVWTRQGWTSVCSAR